ncbi:MAG: hypothetical protein ACRDX9_09980 [Acidimicrobiia bacterium]
MSEPQVPPRSYEELLTGNAALRGDLMRALVRIEELEARLGMNVEELQQATEF